MSQIRVRQVRSAIGVPPRHRGTLRALGLGRIGKVNTLPDRPEIRGMIAKIPHLLLVDDPVDVAAEAPGLPKTAPAQAATKKAATKKKAAPKKAAPKKAAPKKAAPKKAATKKAATKKKAAPKKTTAKKAAP